MRRVRGAAVAGLAALVMSVAGCGGGSPSSTQSSAPTTTVFAAASLSDSFPRIAAQDPTLAGRVSFSFAGSSDLVAQVAAGAPADVLATADEATMRKAVDQGAVAADQVRVFATNTLTVVTPPNDPGGVSALKDLRKPGVSVVLCAPQVPCGAAARTVLDRAGVEVTPVSEEASVADVLGKITSGQADAGFVYVTDARRAGGSVRTVPVPQAQEVQTKYAVGVTTAAQADPQRKAAADAFVGAVVDGPGRRVLEDAGFGAAPSR